MLISEIVLVERQTVDQAAGALKISMGSAWDARITLGDVIQKANSVLGKSGKDSGVEPADAVNQAYYQILQDVNKKAQGKAPKEPPKQPEKPEKKDKDKKTDTPQPPPAPTTPTGTPYKFEPGSDAFKAFQRYASAPRKRVLDPFKAGMAAADSYTKVTKK